MNNNDRYNKALRTNPREAAALAIEFSAGCGSRSNAWNWAHLACAAAAEIGINLDGGSDSWPDLDAMTRQLDAARP